MKLYEAVLWPGTKICRWLGVDPTSDAGLIRWMVNTIIYLAVSMTIVWTIVV